MMIITSTQHILCIYQDVATAQTILTIFLIKDIQLGVAGQTFEVSVKNRLRRLVYIIYLFLATIQLLINCILQLQLRR